MADIVFYNQKGQPVAYCKDNTHIYLFDGTPAAYLNQGSVYSYTGVHLGRFQKGWIRDNRGNCVFYTDNAIGGPVKPVKRVSPVKSARCARPAKSARQARPASPAKTLSWSTLTSKEFFTETQI